MSSESDTIPREVHQSIKQQEGANKEGISDQNVLHINFHAPKIIGDSLISKRTQTLQPKDSLLGQ